MSQQLTAEQMKVLDQLVQERYKASSATPGIAPTGVNSLFNTPGLNPLISTTYIGPDGIENFLEQNGHVMSTNYMQELYGIITGQTASTGEEQTAPCADSAPVAGDLKLCQQTWVFGEMTMNSKSIRMDNLGELYNSASPINLQLINNPFATEIATQAVPMQVNEIFRSAIAKSVVELANDFKRRYARLAWDGNPGNVATYWARFWVVLPTWPYENDGYWGDAGYWGDGGSWGTEAPTTICKALIDAVRKWKSSHAACIQIICIVDGGVWGYPIDETWGSGTWDASQVFRLIP